MKHSATPSRLRTPRKGAKDTQSALIKWQAIASIAASIAVPLTLAVVGYLVQRQLASEGLKKDYVQIATSILKENPNSQDKELRKWAVEVLDRNADIPFSENAKTSLEKGFPLVRRQLVFPDAPKECMEPPERTKLFPLIKSTFKGQYVDIGDQKKFLLKLTDETGKAELNSARLKCLQEWIISVKKIANKSNAKEYGLSASLSTDTTDSKAPQSAP